MKLTTFTDYSLRVLIYLAARPRQRATIAETAAAFGISQNHLTKVVHFLARHGWIETVRGKGGGMRLAAAPADINLGEVVRSIEPDFSLVDCLTTAKSCTLTGSCRLTGIVSDALQSFMAHLDRHSLADLLPPPPVAGSARQRPVTFGKRASPTARG